MEKVFAKAVEQALRKNGPDSLKSRQAFYQMLESIPEEYAMEKEYLREHADSRWLKICSEAKDGSLDDLKSTSRKATGYLCDNTKIGHKAARHLSKGMVVGIAACSQHRPVEMILGTGTAPGAKTAPGAETAVGGRTAPGMAQGAGSGGQIPGRPVAENVDFDGGYDDYDEYVPVPPNGSGRNRRPVVIAAVVLAVLILGFVLWLALGGEDDVETTETTTKETTAMEQTTEQTTETTTQHTEATTQRRDTSRTLYVQEPDGYANVRAGRGTDYDVIGKLYNGSAVIVDDFRDGWYVIQQGEYAGGFISGSTLTDKPSVSETADTEDIFVAKCWDWTRGQTLGASSYVLFHDDGTFSEYFPGSDDLYWYVGTYEYEDGVLYMTDTDTERSLVSENEEYTGDAHGFESVDEYEMQSGSGYYTLTPNESRSKYFKMD